MRIKHNQLDGLFVYKPIPIAVLSATFFTLRLSAALGTLGMSYFYNRKLMKWGLFQLCSTLSFMVNKELFLKFTCLSVLVTAITEILTKSVAYSKCSPSQVSDATVTVAGKNCNIELIFVALGVLYSFSAAGMVFKMLTAPAPSGKKRI